MPEDHHSPNNPGVAATLARGAAASRPAWLKKLLLASAVMAVAVATLFWWQRPTPVDTPRYKTQAAQRGDLKVTITATGTLAPVNQVQVGSELSGTVKSVEVDYNDRVRIGQVLARLDTAKLATQVRQSRASLDAARGKVLQTSATVAETSQHLARVQAVREISQGRAISQHDLDAAQAAFDRAQADQSSAEASLSQAAALLQTIEADLAKAVIVSPINGVVISRSVEPGQTVAASLQAPVLFALAEDLAKMALHVDVDEADVGQVRAGQAAIFTVDAYPERGYPARISQVRYGAKTVGGVVTYETLLEVNNSDLSLRPGMTATANITVKEVHNALLAPNAALRFMPPAKSNDSNNVKSKNGGSVLSRLFPRPRHPAPVKKELNDKGAKKAQRVWLLQEGNLTPLPVSTGATDGISTEITGGNLQAGQELVVDHAASKP